MKSLVRIISAGLVIFVDLFIPRKKKVDLVRDKVYLCCLTKMDQQGDNEFMCGAYEPVDPKESETEI